MTDRDLPTLGDLELEVMQALWEKGPLTVDAARASLLKPLKEVTVRTVLRRLEAKGFVTHDQEGRTFIYRAVERRGTVAARAVKRVVDWFCQGSLDEVLVGMVDTQMLDRRKVKRLLEQIGKSRKQRD